MDLQLDALARKGLFCLPSILGQRDFPRSGTAFITWYRFYFLYTFQCQTEVTGLEWIQALRVGISINIIGEENLVYNEPYLYCSTHAHRISTVPETVYCHRIDLHSELQFHSSCTVSWFVSNDTTGDKKNVFKLPHLCRQSQTRSTVLLH